MSSPLTCYAERVNHRQLEALIRRCYKAGLSLCLWGAPGIGKSQTVRKVGRELAGEMGRRYAEWNGLPNRERAEVLRHPEAYFVLLDMRLSQYDPSDLKGIPNLEGPYTEWKPPLWLHTLSREGAAGFIFLDELNLAPPSVQAAAYQLVLDRCVSDCRIAEGVGVIAAGNPPEYRPQAHDPPPPLLNRFLHVELEIPSPEAWAEWALQHGVDPRIVSFLRARPELLFRWDPESRSAAFPTPRTWEFASRLLEGEEDPESVRVRVSAAVGQGTAHEFAAFLKLCRGFDAGAVLADPEGFPLPREPDQVYALLASLQSHYLRHKEGEVLERLFALAHRLSSELSAEYSVYLLKSLKSLDPELFRRRAEESERFGRLAREIVGMAYG
jgi:MoxR-like ATPase